MDGLRDAIQAVMDQRGMNRHRLGLAVQARGGTVDAVYKYMDGKRAGGPKLLERIADSLDTTVIRLQAQAGLISGEELQRILGPVSTAKAIANDPLLSPWQRRVLTDVYREFVGMSVPDGQPQSGQSRMRPRQ